MFSAERLKKRAAKHKAHARQRTHAARGHGIAVIHARLYVVISQDPLTSFFFMFLCFGISFFALRFFSGVEPATLCVNVRNLST
jgi:hypothetical protein